jgi:hypothetical protein
VSGTVDDVSLAAATKVLITNFTLTVLSSNILPIGGFSPFISPSFYYIHCLAIRPSFVMLPFFCTRIGLGIQGVGWSASTKQRNKPRPADITVFRCTPRSGAREASTTECQVFHIKPLHSIYGKQQPPIRSGDVDKRKQPHSACYAGFLLMYITESDKAWSRGIDQSNEPVQDHSRSGHVMIARTPN